MKLDIVQPELVWAGKVPIPKSQAGQISIAPIYKFMQPHHHRSKNSSNRSTKSYGICPPCYSISSLAATASAH